MRIAASVAVSALVAGALSGCMFFTPQQTSRSYTPSDGVNGHIGDVAIRNVLLLAAEAPSTSQAANMLGVLVNSGDSAQTVTLQYETSSGLETTTLTVPANGLLSLRPNVQAQSEAQVPTEARDLQLQDVDAVPGGLFDVGFTVSGAKPVTLRLPVLTGTLDEYSSLLPTPTPTPTEEPTTSASPEVTGSAIPEPDSTD